MNAEKKKPYIIGITGTIGSGKSTVGQLVSQLSIPVIDTDHIVHNLLASDISVISAIRDRFGAEVLKSNGENHEVNREKLGQIIFNDEKAKKDLESIVHPATILACRRLINQHSNSPIVAVLVPLLFEAKLESEYDEIWTVFTRDEILKKRLTDRDHLDDEDVKKRLGAQMSQEEKTSRAKHVIDNSGTKEETRLQIETLIEKLRSVSSG